MTLIKPTGLNRRAFVTGILGAGAAATGALGQQFDPATGQILHGTQTHGRARDVGVYQIDPEADQRRNTSSFRNRHWSEFFPELGAGVILADINSRSLHYWGGDQSTYRVYATSVPVSEELTKRGKTQIVRKAERPSWTPTADMRRRDPSLPQSVAGGDPDNPLGPFALYLSWPAYLIHGTHDTRKIGRRSSSGCFGLYNENITELYAMAQVGTQVAIF